MTGPVLHVRDNGRDVFISACPDCPPVQHLPLRTAMVAARQWRAFCALLFVLLAASAAANVILVRRVSISSSLSTQRAGHSSGAVSQDAAPGLFRGTK